MANDITAAEAAQINIMNEASHRADMGTVIEELQENQVVSGSYEAVDADANASLISITTGQTTATGNLVRASRSGSEVAAYVESSASSLRIAVTSGSLASWDKITIGDRVDWMVF